MPDDARVLDGDQFDRRHARITQCLDQSRFGGRAERRVRYACDGVVVGGVRGRITP
jgi:hypothetical protein